MNCQNCKRYQGAANPYLGGYGEGPVLIVDAGPSSRDDLAGECHTGPEGALLRGMLVDAGFGPGDTSYIPALKCGLKRAATPQEIDACRPHLAAAIQARQPATIIALGDVALRALTKLGGIQGKRGNSYPLHASFNYPCEVWPTYAPYNVVKSPMTRHVIVADLRRARDRNKPAEVIPWVWWDGSPLPPGPYGFDIETDYDRATKTGGENMIQCAVATPSGTFVAYHDHKLAHKLAAELIGKERVYTLNGWAFDNPKCRAIGIAVPHGIDVMALAYLDDENQSLGLESLAVKYLGVRGWKDLREATPGTAEFALYNAKDALFTLHLAESLEAKLGKRKELITHVLAPARLTLDAVSGRGIPLNKHAISDARREYTERIERAANHIVSITEPGFNPNAARQIAAVLESRGYVLPATAKGAKQVDKRLLQNLDDDFARAILDYREAKKGLTTTILPYDAAAQTSGRLHCEYTIWWTLTGRTSARNPNTQNLPRAFKAFFDVTHVDYSSIEFRLAAWCAREQTILNRYAVDPNWDAHRYFAALFYEIAESEVTAHQRQIAKSANFSQLYLGTGHTLKEYAAAMGINLSRSLCERLHRKWHEAFPGFNGQGDVSAGVFGGFYGRTAAELIDQGYVETATGFRRHFGDFALYRGPDRTHALRQAVNCKVQTLACHIALVGMNECRAAGLPVCGFVHDDVMFDFPKDANPFDFFPEIEYNMTHKPVQILKEHFGVEIDVPLLVEAKYPK